MIQASALWGSLPILQDTESGIAAIEREQMTKPRTLDVEGPLLHQPCSTHLQAAAYRKETSLVKRTEFQVDRITRHTIELLQYSRKLQSMILELKQHRNTTSSKLSDDSDWSDFPIAPPMPVIGGNSKPCTDTSLRFTPKDPNNLFARGFNSAPAEIDQFTLRRLLRHSMAVLCAHAGFDTCMESTLDTLTDVTNEFYLQMMSLLRAAADSAAINGGDTGFPDILSRVFTEMGCGDVTSVHGYYQSHVTGYHERIFNTCQSLRSEYERLRTSRNDIDGGTRLVNRGHADIAAGDGLSSDLLFPLMEDDADPSAHAEGMDASDGGQESLNCDDDSCANTGSRSWKQELGQTSFSLKQEHTSSDLDNRLTESEHGVTGHVGDEYYRPTPDVFSSPGFSDITSPISNRSSMVMKSEKNF